MATRTIEGGFESYRRASDGEWSFGMLGAEVDVHKDDLDRFDRLHPVAATTEEVDSDESSSEGSAEPYKGVTIPDLKAEIEKRNDGREDDKKIVPAGVNRPELVAALVADDATE